MRTPLLLAATLLITSVWASAARVKTQAAPVGEPLSTNFTVSVEGQNVSAHRLKVASGNRELRFKSVDEVQTSGTYFENAAFASFDCEGQVTVSVTCPETVKEAKLLPSSYGLTPSVSGKTVTFKAAPSQMITLEINGDWVHSLHIFANPMETNVPRADDPNVVFFGPGIHEITGLQVHSGQTVYLADGAVVRGKTNQHHLPVFWLQGTNITVRGRGILDGSLCPIHTQHLLEITATNVAIEGIIARDSSVWTVPVRNSENVSFNGVKVLGHRANSDGIDICNSRNVVVSNSFFRTLDDLVVIKTENPQKPSENILVQKCVLWNEVAHALSVGAELRAPVKNVRFADCDVIHDKGREWTLRVYHCDSAWVSDIAFENIRVEESTHIISAWIGKFVWTKDAERGHIQRVLFKDIRATGDHPQIELKGFDAQHEVENVKFDHVQINGTFINKTNIQQNEFVRDVVLTP